MELSLRFSICYGGASLQPPAHGPLPPKPSIFFHETEASYLHRHLISTQLSSLADHLASFHILTMSRLKAPSNLHELVKTAFSKALSANELHYFPTQVAILHINSIPVCGHVVYLRRNKQTNRHFRYQPLANTPPSSNCDSLHLWQTSPKAPLQIPRSRASLLTPLPILPPLSSSPIWARLISSS